MPKKSSTKGVTPTGGALETPGLKSFAEPGGLPRNKMGTSSKPGTDQRESEAVGDYKHGETHAAPRTSVKKGK